MQAIENWKKLEKTKMRLGSPATAERATKKGGWMERFMDEVSGLPSQEQASVLLVSV